MKLFDNSPWKGWKTRKISFTGVCIVWLAYATLGLFKYDIEEPILNFVYKAGVWLLGCGTMLVVSDKFSDKMIRLKGKDEE